MKDSQLALNVGYKSEEKLKISQTAADHISVCLQFSCLRKQIKKNEIMMQFNSSKMFLAFDE